MTIISRGSGGSGDAYSRLVQGLQMEFGSADNGELARRILDAERADFHWNARLQEHYLGQHRELDLGDEDTADELARIAILTFLDGRWHSGVCLIDGNGCATDLLWLRSFERREDADEAFVRARERSRLTMRERRARRRFLFNVSCRTFSSSCACFCQSTAKETPGNPDRKDRSRCSPRAS